MAKAQTRAPAHASSAAIRRWRPSLLVWGSALLALLGLYALMYTPAASWISQYNQSRLIEAYNAQIPSEDRPDPEKAAAIALAREYNSLLSAGAILEAGERIPTGAGNEQGELVYDELLNGPQDLMARLRIPAIDVDLPVYHGTSDETLLRGVGHLRGTSLPVGGDGTHSVLTAHRGLADATLFTNLDKVAVGDTFTIEVLGEVLTYQVIHTQVVEPNDRESLLPEGGRDLVTLVTCTPLGINSHRILVTGERILPTPIADIEAAGADPTVPHFPWWIVILGAGTLAITVYVWRAGYVTVPAEPEPSDPAAED